MMTTNYAGGLLNTLDPRKVNKANKEFGRSCKIFEYSITSIHQEFKGSWSP